MRLACLESVWKRLERQINASDGPAVRVTKKIAPGRLADIMDMKDTLKRRSGNLADLNNGQEMSPKISDIEHECANIHCKYKPGSALARPPFSSPVQCPRCKQAWFCCLECKRVDFDTALADGRRHVES